MKHPWRGSGFAHGNAKLDEYSVRHIRSMKGRISSRDMAQVYEVGRSTIRDIWKGRTWRNVHANRTS